MSNFYCLPGRAGGTPVALEVRWKKRGSRVVASEATPMRRSAADAPAVVTATQRLKHNALIVCITPHPCLFYCRNDHTGPPKVQSRSSFVIYSSGEPPHVFAIARS
jgi:hypothetical protein